MLVLEDDSVSRTFLAEVLVAAGHQVCAVSDGFEALGYAQQQRFDVLLLDLNVPGLGGDQVLANLRDGSADPAVRAASADSRAIVLSADMDRARRASLLAAGFAEVAMKPIAAEDLLTLVEVHSASSESADAANAIEHTALWDDAAALAMTGGMYATVTALRGLLVAELPAQKQRLANAIAAGDWESTAAELHRLRAACGFCGAAQLGRAAKQINTELTASRVPTAAATGALLAACENVIQSAVVTR
ncbi:MAG: response regulator [Pseudomarimonas sp.]